MVRLGDSRIVLDGKDVPADLATLGIRPEHLLPTSVDEGDFAARVEFVEKLGPRVALLPAIKRHG